MSNRKISPEIIEKEILKQLESNSNISLIFKQLDNNLINKAVNLFKNEFNINDN